MSKKSKIVKESILKGPSISDIIEKARYVNNKSELNNIIFQLKDELDLDKDSEGYEKFKDLLIEKKNMLGTSRLLHLSLDFDDFEFMKYVIDNFVSEDRDFGGMTYEEAFNTLIRDRNPEAIEYMLENYKDFIGDRFIDRKVTSLKSSRVMSDIHREYERRDQYDKIIDVLQKYI